MAYFMVQKNHVMPFLTNHNKSAVLSANQIQVSRTLPYAQLSTVTTILLHVIIVSRRLLTAVNCVNVITTATQSIKNDCKI